MEYNIKDLQTEWISKSLVYEVLKNSLPISKSFIKNRRFFNKSDLEIFIFYKQFWIKEAVHKYWTSEEIGDSSILETVKKSVPSQSENSLNSLQTLIEEAVTKEVKTVTEQFETEKTVLTKEIQQKEKIIKIKDDQTQRYAILKVEEEKEKKEWIKKYEQINDEKGEWMKKFYWLKAYLIVFITLFCLTTLFLGLLLTWVIKL